MTADGIVHVVQRTGTDGRPTIARAVERVTHDADLERAVLGCVILTPSTWPHVEAIPPQAFADPTCAAVRVAVGEIVERGEVLDAITLLRELVGSGRMSRPTATETVSTITESPCMVANVDVHAATIVEHYSRRLLSTIGQALAVRATDPTRPLPELVAGVLATVADVPVPRVAPPTMAASVSTWFDSIGSGVGVEPIATGLPSLDRLLGGGLRAQSVVFGALPGVGKTTLWWQVALHVAETRGPVLVVSLEMSRAELRDMAVAALARVDIAKVRAAHADAVLDADEAQRVTVAAQRVHGSRVVVYDEDTHGCPRTVPAIMAAARACRAVLIVIDNLAEIETQRRHSALHERVGEVMAALRRARKALGVPIVTIAHVGRKAVGAERYARPKPSDLHGGSAIESKADGVLLAHREDLHPTRAAKDGPPATPGVVSICAAKFRGVPPGVTELRLVGSQSRFAEIDGDGISAPTYDPRADGYQPDAHAALPDAGDVPDPFEE